MLQTVFERLPFLDQHRYKRVCKRWNKILIIVIRKRPPDWFDTTYGTHQLVDGDPNNWPTWVMVFIPTNTLPYNARKKKFKKKSDRADYKKWINYFTGYFIQHRIELFDQIIGSDLSTNLPICLKNIKEIYISQWADDFAMRMVIENVVVTGNFCMSVKEGKWDGECSLWVNSEPLDLIDRYINTCGVVYGNTAYTHLFEYIVYVTQNWIYNRETPDK